MSELMSVRLGSQMSNNFQSGSRLSRKTQRQQYLDSQKQKSFFKKMQDRLVIQSAEILQNNIVNEYVFCIFLLTEHLCMLQEPLIQVLRKIDPSNTGVDYYEKTITRQSVEINVILNMVMLFNLLVFVAVFLTLKDDKENNQWYKKIANKYLSFAISLYSTALSIPYLMSNFQFLSCQFQSGRSDCFQSNNLLVFFMNIILLVVFVAQHYFFLVCLDLNFNIPIEHYHSPWGTLRHQSVLISKAIYLSSALAFVFGSNDVMVVIMLVITLLGLLARNLLKFRNSYYLDCTVNLVDNFLNSFMVIFIFLAILISQVDLPYSYNSLYLLFFISVLFATALSYVHSFHRGSALERFFTNFQQISSDIDFSTNTVIDYLQSKSKKDAVRIKGLIQLIINESGCDAAKKRQRDKVEKYSKYLFKQLEQNQNQGNLAGFNSQNVTALGSHSAINQDMMASSAFRRRSDSDQAVLTRVATSNVFPHIPPHRKSMPKQGRLAREGSQRNIVQTPINSARKITHSAFKESDFHIKRVQMQSDFEINQQVQKAESIDLSHINLVAKTDQGADPIQQSFDQNSRVFGAGPLNSVNNLQEHQYYDDQYLQQMGQGNMYLSEEESDEEEEDTDRLLNQICDIHNYQDVNLILEVIQYFLTSMKDSNIKSENTAMKQVRLMLLKIRLIYLAHKLDKLHYLMFLISKLDNSNSFQIKTIKYIFQKKFHQVFQSKIVEKKDKFTPTTLVMYEHHREEFETTITEATENMMQLVSDLRVQGTSVNEITRRFDRAKFVINITLELEKRFKSITDLNAQQIDLVGMYFHFLDQVVHMENEARNVLKIMIDLSSSDKLNKRFEAIDITKSKGTGFILVSGNQRDIGNIIKINNSICNYLQYFKDDLYSKKIGYLMPDCIAQYHDVIIGNYINIQKSNKENSSQSNASKKKQKLAEEAKEGEESELRLKIKRDKKDQNQWHLTKKNDILMFKSKQGLMQPLTCNFDIYFDLTYGIQFMCLAQQRQWFNFEEQKVLRKSVFIIQTTGQGIIESFSNNFVQRYGLASNKILDERVDIQHFHEGLYDFGEKFSALDTTGMPVLLNFNHLKPLQSEESKLLIEKYQKKLVMKGRKMMTQMSRGNLTNLEGSDDEGGVNALSQTLLGHINIGQRGNLGDLLPQVVFVKRQIIMSKPSQSSKDITQSPQHPHQNLHAQNSGSSVYEMNFLQQQTATMQASGPYQNSNYQTQTQTIQKINSNDQDFMQSQNSIRKAFRTTMRGNFTSPVVNTDRIQGIYYFVIFQDGMTLQMREMATQYQEDLHRQYIEQIERQKRQGGMFGDNQARGGFENAILMDALFNTNQVISQNNISKSDNVKVSDLNGSNQTNTQVRDQSASIASKSDDQFTFASTTSSTTSSNSKDKITELKNETFLGQVPVFVNLFRRVFLLQFILFVVVGTVILVVSYNSNDQFFNDIESINLGKTYYSQMSVQQMLFRGYLNVGNGVEKNQSSLAPDRFDFMLKKLQASNNQLQSYLTKLRTSVKNSKNSYIKSLFTAPNSLVYDLTELSQVSTRNISLDESMQLLVVITQMFTQNIDERNTTSLRQSLLCNCSLSNVEILARRQYNNQMISTGQSGKLLKWTYNERQAFFFIENTNMYLTQSADALANSFLTNSSSEVDKYKNQILILVICCVSLALICSIAFIPYYLRTRKNLNLNIYLIEKMSVTSLDEISNNILAFYRQLSKSRGKYGGNSQDMVRAENLKNQQQERKNQNSPVSKGQIRDTKRSSFQAIDERKKNFERKNNLAKKNQGGGAAPTPNMKDAFVDKQNNKATFPNNNKPGAIIGQRGKNSQFTTHTYKTTEGLHAYQTSNPNEEYKFNEKVGGANEDISRFNSEDSENDKNKISNRNRREEIARRLAMNKKANKGNRHKHSSEEEDEEEKEEDRKNDQSSDSSGSSSDEDKKKRKNKKKQDEAEDKEGGTESIAELKFQEIIREKRRSLSEIYFKQKVKIIFISMLFATVLSAFFILDYFLMANTFDESISSIKQFQVFYQQVPCLVTGIQLHREQFLKNESEFFVYEDFTQVGQIFQECMMINSQIRAMKQNYPATLSDAIPLLNAMDSSKYCSDILPQLGKPDLVQECQSMMDGVFGNGYSNGVSTILNYFNMIQLKYDSLAPAQRTQSYLTGELQNQKSVDYTMVYYKYIDDTNNFITDQITSSFIAYFNKKIVQFTAVYAVFILVLVFSILFLQFFVMSSIKREIYLARKTIQLVPHKELTNAENYDIASKIKY